MSELGAKIKVGTRFEVSGVFTALGGTGGEDPDSVKLVLRKPDGTEVEFTYGTDPEVTRTGVGDYAFKHVPDQVGTYWCVWQAVSALSGVSAQEEIAVRVEGTVVSS